MNKQFECENCKKKFTTKQRKMNHFKICNYENLEKEITDLKFENFLLKSVNHNNNKARDLLCESYKNDIHSLYELFDDLENVNIDK